MARAGPQFRSSVEAGPDMSAFAPDIVVFNRCWDSKRRGDPAEIVYFPPGVVLTDVVADDRRCVYRLVGTREVAMRGRDPTGKSGLRWHRSSPRRTLER